VFDVRRSSPSGRRNRVACHRRDAAARGEAPPGAPAGGKRDQTAILAAGRRHFAERGLDRATIRAIAKHADVDSALVLHFGSKAVFVTAAMTWPFDTDAAVDQERSRSPASAHRR
jgi:AcrR family transcriptional regulator